MRWLLTLVVLFGGSYAIERFASPPTPDRDRWGELELLGRIAGFAVGPHGTVALSTMTGEIAVADSADGDWRLSRVPYEQDSLSFGPTIDQIHFFDQRRALATGYLGAGQFDVQDRVLRSEDGGATWESVPMGVSQWVDAVFVTPQGDAWIGGLAGDLRHSADYGRTWQRLGVPFPNAARVASLWLTTSRDGYVGALSNHLSEIHDGGRTFTPIVTPLDQKLYRPDVNDDNRVDLIRTFGDWLIVRQDGNLFRRRGSEETWLPMPDSLITIEIGDSGRRLVGVTADLRALQYDSALAAPATLGRLSAYPIGIAVRGETAFAIDKDAGISIFRPGNPRYLFPLTSEHPQLGVDRVRTTGGAWIGTTRHHLYRSTDSAKSWTRLATSAAPMTDALLRDDGRILLWDRHGHNQLFDPAAGRFSSVPGIDSLDVIDVIAAGATWFAYGGMQNETARRVDAARTFFAGQFAGSVPFGHVSRSIDQGLTWRRIDRWDSAGVAIMYPAESGSLYLLSYLGSVRELRPEGRQYRAIDLIEAHDSNRDSVPYVQNPFAIYFGGNGDGHVIGDIHHLGTRAYRTTDAGRHWVRVDPATIPFARLFILPSGVVGSTGSNLQWVGRSDRPRLFEADCEEDPDWVKTMGEGTSGGCIVDVSQAGPSQLLVETIQGLYSMHPAPPRYHLVNTPDR